MAYLIPSRTPPTPQQAERDFDYLMALQTGGAAPQSPGGRTQPRSRRSSCCGWPRTSSDPPRPRTGRPNRARTPSRWTRPGRAAVRAAGLSTGLPHQAAPGTAHSILRLTVNTIPDPHRPDTADALEAIRDQHLMLAHAVHSAPGAHQQPTAHSPGGPPHPQKQPPVATPDATSGPSPADTLDQAASGRHWLHQFSRVALRRQVRAVGRLEEADHEHQENDRGHPAHHQPDRR